MEKTMKLKQSKPLSYIEHLSSSMAHFSINLGTMLIDLLFLPNAHKSSLTKGLLNPWRINL